MSLKRARYFTEQEVEALVSGVEKRKCIIRGKLGSRSNARRAWTEITDEVNSVCISSPQRTVEELKKKFKSVESYAKIKANSHQNDVASGILPSSKLSLMDQRVSALSWDEQTQTKLEDWTENSSENSVEFLSESERPEVLFVDVPNMVPDMVPDPVVGRHVATQTISSGDNMDPRSIQGEQKLALLETMSHSMQRQAAAMETIAGLMGQCLELLRNQNNK